MDVALNGHGKISSSVMAVSGDRSGLVKGAGIPTQRMTWTSSCQAFAASANEAWALLASFALLGLLLVPLAKRQRRDVAED